jgi:hypothetical protein
MNKIKIKKKKETQQRRAPTRELGPTTTYRLGVVVGGWWRSPRKVT